MPSHKCSEALKVSRIKVAEKGKQAVFLNPDRDLVTRTQVDGCLVKQTTACDWLIVRDGKDGVLVELKGCDVSKALDQIEATFAFLKQSRALTPRMAALIVCRNPPNHPSFGSKLQRVKDRLSSTYRAPLHVVAGNYEYCFEKVLSQRGPL